LRTKEGREGFARDQQQKECKAKAAAAGVDLSGYDGKLTLTGKPDARTKEGKEYYQSKPVMAVNTSSSSKISSSSSVNTSIGQSFVARKDG
jgi:hypothetical protein